MKQQDFLPLLLSASAGVRAEHRKVVEAWAPEQAPVTVLYGALGFRIAREFAATDIETCRRLFALIEQAMERGDTALATAVATGLIEALGTYAVQVEGLWETIAPLLGPRSRHHAEAWLFG